MNLNQTTKYSIPFLHWELCNCLDESTYQLIGEYESDINNNKISIISPLARALISKKKNDVVEVNSPKGTKIYTVISVKYK